MTSETNPASGREAFRHNPGPEAETVISRTLASLQNIEDELRVVEGLLTHGAGFAAFLRLEDTAPHEPTLVHRYEQSYADTWETLDDLVVDTIEALGWREELTALKKRESIPDDYLAWNHAAIHERLHEMYSFVTLDGWIHAFHR